MSQSELLRQVTTLLDRNGIDYMLTGSVVSSLQGVPRSTHDIDIVISLHEADIEKLAEGFSPPRFYLNRQAMRDALAHKSMFNLIDVIEGDKVDFWILTDHPFDQSRFARKSIDEFMGMRLKVSRPEDTILAKLQWSVKSGGSEKQLTDALHIYEVQRASLDVDYLNQWVEPLGITSLWLRLLDEATIEKKDSGDVTS
ncbi:MAG: hypothetical protein ACKVT0_23995 [Planctomycetaceae bacterium]